MSIYDWIEMHKKDDVEDAQKQIDESLTDHDMEKKKNARDYVFSGRAIFTLETKNIIIVIRIV